MSTWEPLTTGAPVIPYRSWSSTEKFITDDAPAGEGDRDCPAASLFLSFAGFYPNFTWKV